MTTDVTLTQEVRDAVARGGLALGLPWGEAGGGGGCYAPSRPRREAHGAAPRRRCRAAGRDTYRRLRCGSHSAPGGGGSDGRLRETPGPRGVPPPLTRVVPLALRRKGMPRRVPRVRQGPQRDQCVASGAGLRLRSGQQPHATPCPPPIAAVDNWELRQVLEAMGQKPTEEELFQMISEVDDNMSGAIGSQLEPGGRARCSVTASLPWRRLQGVPEGDREAEGSGSAV